MNNSRTKNSASESGSEQPLLLSTSRIPTLTSSSDSQSAKATQSSNTLDVNDDDDTHSIDIPLMKEVMNQFIPTLIDNENEKEEKKEQQQQQQAPKISPNGLEERPRIKFILPANPNLGRPHQHRLGIAPIIIPTDKEEDQSNSSSEIENFVEPTNFSIACKFPTHFFQKANEQFMLEEDDEDEDEDEDSIETFPSKSSSVKNINNDEDEKMLLKGPNIRKMFAFLKNKPFFPEVKELLKKNYLKQFVLVINPFKYDVYGIYALDNKTRSISKIWGTGNDVIDEKSLKAGAYYSLNTDNMKFIILDNELGFTRDVDAVAL